MSSVFKYLFFILLVTVVACQRESVTEVIDDGIPPRTPVGLHVAFAVDGEVRIEWQKNNEGGIKGYNIFRSINDTINFIKIGFSNSNFFFDDSLEYDSTYFYRITAVDIFGLESKPSLIVNAKPVNKYRPLRVRELEINARNWTDKINIFLTWKPTGESDIKNYLIYRSDKSGFDISDKFLLDSTNSFSYSDTNNLKLLQNYFYKIVAKDKGGLTSRASTEVVDMILDKPLLVFPAMNDTLNYFNNFKIETSGAPAQYRIVIQSNPFTGILAEKDFFRNESHTQISVHLDISFDSYQTYYWQVYTFTNNEFNPNSISKLSKFTIVPAQ